MPKTDKEWCNFSLNPVKGLCPMDCRDLEGKPYCYARKMYHRFHWDTEIRFVPSVGDELHKMPDGSRVFWGSTMELFGDWIEPEWWKAIMNAVQVYDNLTHIFLTKCPQNLPKEWPDNCWIGASVTNRLSMSKSLYGVFDSNAKVRFLSIEPMLSPVVPYVWPAEWDFINWLIIGARTQPLRYPDREWCQEIISAADKAKIPVFIKEPLASYLNIQRQEYPSV